MFSGRVLITGGSGFLGRGILRRAKRENWPCEFTIYSRDEYKQAICRKMFPHARYVLGDIQNADRLYTTALGHDIIIDAAAIKYVPESEFNVLEAIDVNVNGTISVFKAAIRAGVQQVVGISTDKAVRPVNVYGMTKALMERIFSSAADKWGPKFTCVRYGNVVGSTGSVVPVFKDQFFSSGVVRVTDPKMTRFWMNVDQAVDVISVALDPFTAPGTIIVPKPKAMSIGDVAACIAGVHIEVVGARPGEKYHEELIHFEESLRVNATIKKNYYYLLPVETQQRSQDPFTVTSNQPPAGWVTRDEMLSWMADADELCV